MKIQFLIEDPPVTIVSDWEEIKVYQKKGYLTPTFERYSLFKALEQNRDFENAIKSARNNAGIPEDGFSWETYYKNYNPRKANRYSEMKKKASLDLFMKVYEEMMEIRKTMELDFYVSDQLMNLIYGNFVSPVFSNIMHGHTPFDDEADAYFDNIFINIYNKVSKNELLKYIENNWEDIETLINRLPPKPKYSISKRDYRIMELRDLEKLSFKNIADKIIQELHIDDAEGVINEDTVKTAYRRAKQKVDSLANKY